jgi:hypothetical protein
MRKKHQPSQSQQLQMLHRQQILIFKAWLVTLPTFLQRPLILMEQSPLTNGAGVTGLQTIQHLRLPIPTHRPEHTQSA